MIFFVALVAFVTIGQGIAFLQSFAPARAVPPQPQTTAAAEHALESSAWRHARNARVPALAQALISPQEPPSTFGRYVAERIKDALTVWVFVGLALCMRS